MSASITCVLCKSGDMDVDTGECHECGGVPALMAEKEQLRKALAAEIGRHQETLKMLAFAIEAYGAESGKANKVIGG